MSYLYASIQYKLKMKNKLFFSTMTSSFIKSKWNKPLKTKSYGLDILHDPLWNKSMAFDYSERDRLGLRGLIPPAIRSIDAQLQSVLIGLKNLPDDVSKNLFLQELHDRNETLYHRVLLDHIEDIAPLVYTPTVGYACQQFGYQFRRSRGMYFSREDRGQFNTMVYNWPHDDVHVIVVTDGSRILGLGDLGCNGMGIPIGKLALYCAAGGIAPHRVLPVCLDVGTNNNDLLKDPLYIGIRKPRLQGDEYFEMIDEFMHAVTMRWPEVVIQFEDFETSKAVPLLERYRYNYRIFNDDIQGTGCVTLAGILSSAKIAGKDFSEMKYLCVGAGSAGLGVCSALIDAMILRNPNLSREDALKKFVVMTKDGAIGKKEVNPLFGNPNHSLDANLTSRELDWANDTIPDGSKLLDVIKQFKPTVLLGLSAAGPIFTEEVIRTMASYCEHPVIMPMSNPTTKAECSAANAYDWTDGRAIFASGSPFPVHTMKDGRVLTPSQCNNMYIFPGIGLAASVGGLSSITDKMLFVAAEACANSLLPSEMQQGRVFPSIQRIRDVSLQIAVAMIKEAVKFGLSSKIKERHLNEGLENYVRRKMYHPTYVALLPLNEQNK